MPLVFLLIAAFISMNFGRKSPSGAWVGAGLGDTPECRKEQSYINFFLTISFLHFFFFPSCFYTFADLAVPVFVRGTVRIIPVPPVVSIDFCTVFSIIVIIWLAHAPVFKARLHRGKSKTYK